jgi:hypothetical protein
MDRLNQPLVNHIRSNSVNHRDARLRPAPAVTKGPAGHTPRFRSLTVVRFGRFGGDADGGNGAHFGAARNRDASSLCSVPPAIFCSLRSKEIQRHRRALSDRAKGWAPLATRRPRSGLSRHRPSARLRLMVVQMDLAPATPALILRISRNAGDAPARPRAARRQPTRLLRLLRRRK